MPEQFLRDVAVLLAASVPILFITRPLRLPPIVGFLLTGVLIGPYGLGLLRDPHSVEQIAELGVILILFFVGLEFPLARLQDLGRGALVSGVLQIVLTVAVVAGFTYYFAETIPTAIFYGLLVAFSSTAVVLPVLTARAELFSPYGGRTLGVLLMQDLLVIPVVLLLPVFGGRVQIPPSRVLMQVSLALVGLVIMVIVARFIVPVLMDRIGRLGSEEGFITGLVLLVMGMVAAAQTAGVSAALGAFAAGIVLAETPYVHKTVAALRPFRDLLSSLFFASIGMLLDPRFVFSRPVAVITVIVLLIVIKAGIAYPSIRAASALPSTALRAAFALANVGEFSFVLAQVGSRNGLLTRDAEQFFVTAAVASFALAPSIISLGNRLARRLPQELGTPTTVSHHGEATMPKNHVIVVGSGLNGRNVVRVLSQTDIPHVVVEEDPDRAAEAAKISSVVLADGESPHTFEVAGIQNAVLVVVAISAPEPARRIARICRELNPAVRILVRTRYVSEVDALRAAGADEVVPEEFETSLEIITRVLRLFHVPGNVVAAQLRMLRDETYLLLRDGSAQLTEGRKLSAMLAGGTSETFLVLPDAPADGKTLHDLKLDSDHIAVPAVIRDGLPFTAPPPDFRVAPGDILLLVGAHEDLNRTISRLETN